VASIAAQSASTRPATLPPWWSVEENRKRSPIESPFGLTSMARKSRGFSALVNVSVRGPGESWPLAGRTSGGDGGGAERSHERCGFHAGNRRRRRQPCPSPVGVVLRGDLTPGSDGEHSARRATVTAVSRAIRSHMDVVLAAAIGALYVAETIFESNFRGHRAVSVPAAVLFAAAPSSPAPDRPAAAAAWRAARRSGRARRPPEHERSSGRTSAAS
jgi:hypothetical protein